MWPAEAARRDAAPAAPAEPAKTEPPRTEIPKIEAPKRNSALDYIFTPRLAPTVEEVKAHGIFFLIRPDRGTLKNLFMKKQTFTLKKAASKDIGNAYFVECIDSKGKAYEGFPLALSHADEIKNVNELSYEFELLTVAAGVHRFRFEKMEDFSTWKAALEAAISASKKRNERGSMVLSLVERVKSAFLSGDI